jgi:hypothetical protein
MKVFTYGSTLLTALSLSKGQLAILSNIITIIFFVSSCQMFPTTTKSKVLSSYDPQVKQLLVQMTLEEKIGQMIQADQEHIKDLSDIEKYYLGSVLSGGNSDPKDGNSLDLPTQYWPWLYA